MKRRKKIYVLLGVLAAVSIVTLVVRQIEDNKEKIRNTDEVILSVDTDSVDSLSWKYDDTELSFHKKNDTWYWDGDEAFPVNMDVIDDLISDFRSFGAAFIIEDAEDLSQYGLDDPVCTIEMTAGEDRYEVLLGAFSAMDSQRYVSTGDGNVYLVKNDPFDDFELILEDTIYNDSVPSMSEVTSIEFAGSENYAISYMEDSKDTYCSDDVYFIWQNGNAVPLDTSKVKSYISAVKGLSLTDYVSYDVTDEELAGWGLDQPLLTVTVYYKDSDGNSQSYVINIGQNQEQAAEKEAAEAKGEEYTGTVSSYVRVGQSSIVYNLLSSKYETLNAVTYNDLRHEEVITADFESVTQIDITMEGTEYSVVSDGKDEPVYSYQDTEVDIEDLKSALSALAVNKFTDEVPSGKEEVSLIIHLENENYPEISVEIYRYDGTSCLVVLDGNTLGYVNRSEVVDLIEAVNTIVLG